MEERIQQITAWLSIFLAPGQVSELRALNVGGRKAVTDVFSDVRQMAVRALELEAAGATGIYFTPNPLRSDLAGSRRSARKADVIARRWLLIDVDPVRPADTSATDAERRAAWDVLCRVRGTLDAAGFAGAVVGDSGNGWHLSYPVDMPNDDASQEKIKGVLQGLHRRCSDAAAVVDVKTFDAPRIWKMYGLLTRKGAATAERPHRYSRIVEFSQ